MTPKANIVSEANKHRERSEQTSFAKRTKIFDSLQFLRIFCAENITKENLLWIK